MIVYKFFVVIQRKIDLKQLNERFGINWNMEPPNKPEQKQSASVSNYRPVIRRHPEGMLHPVYIDCIVFIHLYSASCSAHQSEALPVQETQREESRLIH